MEEVNAEGKGRLDLELEGSTNKIKDPPPAEDQRSTVGAKKERLQLFVSEHPMGYRKVVYEIK